MSSPDLNEKGELVLQVLRRIGTPAGTAPDVSGLTPDGIGQEYDLAYENRIGLLYLLALQDRPIPDELARERLVLVEREAKTRQVVLRLCQALDGTGVPYVIFKTVRPFPFTPNDTDVLFLGTRDEYKAAVDNLLQKGYRPHGQAPLQTLVYDPEGVGRVGKHKEGGIYYIDLYRAAGADYFVYLDPRRAAAHTKSMEIEGVQIPVLCPELELAVLLFHNVFPENTYHLEHFYLPLYYLCGQSAVDVDSFVSLTKENHFSAPVRVNLSITARLHDLAFGYVPEELEQALALLGSDQAGVCRFEETGLTVPYHFRGRLFVTAALAKLQERASLASFFEQGAHMLSPPFLWSVIKAVRLRIAGVGVYEQA